MKLSLSVSQSFAVLASLALTGCCQRSMQVVTQPPAVYEHVVVEYASGAATASPPAEVRTTVTYTSRIATIRSVTIRFPDSCVTQSLAAVTQSAAQMTGVGTGSTVILRNDCAVWLAELERSLAGAGYRVISGDALYRLEGSTNPRLSTYVAAQQLGADAVFVINSLETSDVQRGARFAGSLTYYQSNPRGETVQLREFDDNVRLVFQTMVRNRLAPDSPTPGAPPVVQALAGILDTTAVIAGSGESMWFYRRNVSRRLAAAQNVRFLFMGSGLTWRPIERERQQVVDVQQTRSSARDTFGDETQAGNNDPLAAERHAMVRMVVEDFVRQFRGTP